MTSSEDSTNNSDLDEDEPFQVVTIKKARLLDEFKQLLDEMKANSSVPKDSLPRELDMYFSMDVSNIPIGKSLDFWKQNQQSQSLLAQLTQIYFDMSSSSVAVQSMFSMAALICNGK